MDSSFDVRPCCFTTVEAWIFLSIEVSLAAAPPNPSMMSAKSRKTRGNAAPKSVAKTLPKIRRHLSAQFVSLPES